MRTLFRAVLVLAVAVAAGAGYLAYRLTRPYQGFANQIFIEFPKGTSTRQMAAMLQSAGVVQNAWDFELARAVRPRAKLQAGEYRFSQPASTLNVFDRIARGDIFYYQAVVPEGKNMFEIGDLIHRLGLFPAHDFLTAARDPSLIRDLDPQAPSLEGYLFPDTYRLTRHATPDSVCRMMTARFRAAWKGLGTSANVHHTITLASLVEKEGKLPEERPVIAAVFLKRLQMGMKLDSDPTTIYAALVEGRYRGTIFKTDLASDNPYNTYRRAGLPPGPIANPGIASIRAVLNPAATDYLYFVARPDGSGGHAFSKTLEDQAVAIQKYRRGLDR